MTDKKQDYYAILSVPKDATLGDIKRAYRKLAKQYHPDTETGDEEVIRKVNGAYEVLSDREKRALYDRHGHSLEPVGAEGRVQPGNVGVPNVSVPNTPVQDYETWVDGLFTQVWGDILGYPVTSGSSRTAKKPSATRTRRKPPVRRNQPKEEKSIFLPENDVGLLACLTKVFEKGLPDGVWHVRPTDTDQRTYRRFLDSVGDSLYTVEVEGGVVSVWRDVQEWRAPGYQGQSFEVMFSDKPTPSETKFGGAVFASKPEGFHNKHFILETQRCGVTGITTPLVGAPIYYMSLAALARDIVAEESSPSPINRINSHTRNSDNGHAYLHPDRASSIFAGNSTNKQKVREISIAHLGKVLGDAEDRYKQEGQPWPDEGGEGKAGNEGVSTINPEGFH